MPPPLSRPPKISSDLTRFVVCSIPGRYVYVPSSCKDRKVRDGVSSSIVTAVRGSRGTMVLYQLFLRVAFLVTALIHLWFNDVVKATISVAALCLSDPKRPIIQSILRLHSVVLVCFVLAFCFNAVSAFSDQTVVGRPCDVLKVRDKSPDEPLAIS